MNLLDDARLVQTLQSAQRGVYSKADLQIALAERHPAAFGRRVGALLEHDVLRRFRRGWYVTEDFSLPTLSQRLAPESYVSFGTILATHLLVGTKSERHILAVKTGRTRKYASGGYVVEHLGISPNLFFGFEAEDGVRRADAEKAALDVLYFHLRGRRYAFDLYSDIDVNRLDRKKVSLYLERYANPKFVTFARRVLRIA